MNHTPKSPHHQSPFQRGRIALIAWLAAACVLATTACSGGAGTSRTGSDTLTIAAPSAPTTLDVGSGNVANTQFYDLAYEPLVTWRADGSYTPGLATSWKIGPQNRSWSLTLRRGVKFSDGTPLTPQAVKTWIEYATHYPGGIGSMLAPALSNISIDGPTSLTLHFSKPMPNMQMWLGQGALGAVASPKAVQAKSLGQATAGAGAYMIDPANTVTGDHYTYIPNPHYYNPKAIHWKKITIRVIPNPNSTLQALKSGQVQLAVNQPGASINEGKSAGLNVTAPPQSVYMLGLLDRDGKLAKPLADVRVRQAINYAIDRSAIAKGVFGGNATPTDQTTLDSVDSYDPALESRYPYDPAKAKQLLAKAGYPNGFTLSTVSANYAGFDTFAEAVAGQLASVGITLKIDIKSSQADYTNSLSSGKYPTAAVGFGGLPADLMYLFLWGQGPVYNPFHTPSSKLAALHEQYLHLPAAQAKKVARQMAAYVVQQAWFAPVVTLPIVALSTKDIAGVDASSSGRPLWYLPEVRQA